MKRKYVYAMLALIIVVFITSLFPPFRILYLNLFGYLGRQTLPTVDGPENLTLIRNTQGYIVYNVPVGGIKAISLPSMSELTIREADKGHEPVRSLSGPDENGCIVYIENHMGDKAYHLLKLTAIGGEKDEIIFSHRGDALWDDVIGNELALAPKGGHVAFVGKLTSAQMHEPEVLLETGPLEIWNIDQKTKKDAEITALDEGLSWFPDGRRLAYTKFVPKDDIQEEMSDCTVRNSFWNSWAAIPAIFVYDIGDRSNRYVHTGWHPTVSDDGKSVLVQGYNNEYCLVDLSTQKASAVDWPGRSKTWGKVIALKGGRDIVYMGLLTTGKRPRWTEHNSPLSGPKPVHSIKIANLQTHAFQTVIDYIDPRSTVSYGQIK